MKPIFDKFMIESQHREISEPWLLLSYACNARLLQMNYTTGYILQKIKLCNIYSFYTTIISV